jgi:hypothetical protein
MGRRPIGTIKRVTDGGHCRWIGFRSSGRHYQQQTKKPPQLAASFQHEVCDSVPISGRMVSHILRTLS